MKNRILRPVVLITMFVPMMFGFFFIYASVWMSLGLPPVPWALVACMVLAVASIFGFLWLVNKAGEEETKQELSKLTEVKNE